MLTLARLFLLLLIVSTGIAADEPAIPHFKLRADTPLPSSRRGRVTRLPDGGWRFATTVAPGTTATWRIPVPGDISAKGLARFSLRTHNVKPLPGLPALGLMTQPRKGGASTTVPLFRPLGESDSELGRKTFSTTAARLESIIIQITPSQPAEAVLELHSISLRFHGNLPLPEGNWERAISARVVENEACNLEIQRDGEPISGIARAAINLAGPGDAPVVWMRPDYLHRPAIDAILNSADAGPLLLDILLTSPPSWHPVDASFTDFDSAWHSHIYRALTHLTDHLLAGPHASRIIGLNLILSPALNTLPPDGRAAHPDYGSLPPEKWHSGDLAQLVHPQRHGPGQDAYRYFWRSWADSLLTILGDVKALSQDRWLCGFAGGPAYFLRELRSPGYPIARDAWQAILNSDVLDFVWLPESQLDSPFLSALEASGTLVLTGNSSKIRDQTNSLFTGAKPITATSHPIAGRAAQLPRKHRAEIAIVYDPDIFLHLAPSDSQISDYHYLLRTPQQIWNRLGAPVDLVPIDDFQPEPYRLIIFTPIPFMHRGRREVAKRCQRGGRVVVWTWGTGIANERYLSADNISALTGINCRLDPRPAHFRFVGASPILTPPGLPAAIAPRFFVDDPDIEPFAAYADTQQIAVAQRDFHHWTSVYAATPVLRPEFLGTLADAAGVHRYFPAGEECRINDSFVLIHAQADAVRDITFATPEPLYEPLRKHELPAATRHRLKMRRSQSYLFFRGTRAQWEGLPD